MQATIAGAYATKRDNIVQHDRYRPPNPLTNIYRSQDGRFFLIGMLEADRYWPGLCAALGQPDLAKEERFISMKVRGENSEACVKVLDAIFSQMPLAEITERLNSQEGQWSMVEMPGDTVKDEQSLANSYIQMVKFDNGADLPCVPAPARVDGEAPVLTRAPEHCEHTDAVFESLGHTMDELIDLKVAGVIA